MESIFRSSQLVALTLIIGAFIMWLADRFATQNKNNSITKSFVVGLFQSLALIPGMSRSGMTISGGLFVGLKREDAIRFSFLLAIPILLGTGIKKLIDLIQANLINDLGVSVLVGSISAFVFGLLAIHFLITYLKKHNFNVFIVYRIILALIILLTI